MKRSNKRYNPFILIIMDGFGIRKNKSFNAVALAKKPNLDSLKKEGSYTTLKAAGESVGLPKRQIGSSEVNHLNIGAGRIVLQELSRINRAIQNKSFFKNNVLIKCMRRAKTEGTTLHLIGLVSDGGVHSHIQHIFALIKLAKKQGVKKLMIHAFLDGRDVPPKSAEKYLTGLEKVLCNNQVGSISTLGGRFYGMDRDKRWKREKKAYDAIVKGEGPKYDTSIKALKARYKKGETDEFITPSIIINSSRKDPKRFIDNDDVVLFFNFRSDRARQLTHALIDPRFSKFKTKKIKNLYFTTITEYEKKLTSHIAFPLPVLRNIFPKVISNKGLKQLHIAETEKFAHVTYFFNGGQDKKMKGEDRILINSPKVKTYDLKPQMNADLVTREVIKRIKQKKYGFVVLNIANPDMVGHCGKLKPAIKAVEKTDECVGKIIKIIKRMNGQAIISADHGNAEEMKDKNGQPHTAHTLNPVPCILLDYKNYARYRLRKNGIIGDIAPTMLEMLGFQKPKDMNGKSLIISR